MHNRLRLSRVVLSAAAVATLALACDSVLDIDDPKMRPGEAAGAGGAPDDTAGTDSGGTNTTPKGGNSGEAGSDGPMIAMAGAPGGSGGEAGTGEPAECENQALRCSGDTEETPQICTEGHWVFNNLEADADCPVLCDAGKCVECMPDEKRCSVCEEGDATCSTNRPQSCVDGAWQDADAECAHYCDGGDCKTPPSCPASAGARNDCKLDENKTESCCRSLKVPGGTFSRDYDGSDIYFAKDQYPATVTQFSLDKFEVTVGRMRAFLNAFDQLNLKNGDGKSPHIPADVGWDGSYVLPSTKDALIAQLKCDNATTWSDEASSNNDLPITCVSFNVAYAFCVWDGGRLPSELEWNYASAGGDEQRLYPWKAPSVGPAITPEYANYDAASPLSVGSKFLGNGRWGQADLAGNVAEWTLDFNNEYPDVCTDCLATSSAAERIERGGYYVLGADYQVVSLRSPSEPTVPLPVIGFRCARDTN